MESGYDTAAKAVVDELEPLLGNAASIVQTSKDITSSVQTAEVKDEDISCDLDSCITSTDQVNHLSLKKIYIFGSTLKEKICTLYREDRMLQSMLA